MSVGVVLVDVSADMVGAWREVFAAEPNVTLVHGSILEQKVDAWIAPTNARGQMSGGVDAAIRGHLGPSIQKRVTATIAREHGGAMPVGFATCVPTGRNQPAWLVSTPTMVGEAEPIRNTLHVALACCAAFQAVTLHNEQHAAQIGSIALPGLGAGTGKVPVEACAELMWTAYRLFCHHYFDDFQSMCTTVEAEIAALDASMSSREAASRLRTVFTDRIVFTPRTDEPKPGS